jgi:hypothetical protein
MARTRSAANIAHAKARSGRSSVRRSEPPRRNRRKDRKDQSSPPRRARKKRAPDKKARAKKAKKGKKGKQKRPSTRSLKKPERRGFRVPRLLIMVLVMMGLGFGAVWGLDSWAAGPSGRATKPQASSGDQQTREIDDGPAFGELWDKFVDRLLDRDLPVRKKKKPVLKAKRPEPKPAPAPAPSPAPDARAEAAAPAPADYQEQAKPLEEARQRRVERETTRRQRLDDILKRVGVAER